MDYISSKTAILQNYNSLLLCAPVLAILSGIVLWQRQLSGLKVMNHFPGPKKNILFGHALDFPKDPSDFRELVVKWTNDYMYKGALCIWLGPFIPFLLLYTPEYTELLLSSSRQITKSFVYSFLHPWLKTGLLTSTGGKWKHRRRLITPTFHFKILNEFIQVFEEQSEVLVSVLKHQCDKGPLDIFPKIGKCALDIICKTSMGTSVNAQKDGNVTYVDAVTRISELVQDRQKYVWLYPDMIYNLMPSGQQHKKCLEILHSFTNRIIDDRINERLSSTQKEEKSQVDEFTGKRKRRPLAFLDLLLNAYDDGEIDKEGVREEVDTFMFEGHDTTAAAMSWAIFMLGHHPEIQQKAQEEVDAFFESRPETLTVESLKDLKYLECVIKEALRLYPSVPFFARELTEDFSIDGVVVPKGTTVGTAPFALHTNPKVWPDPYKFDPDRFLPENSQGRHPYAYIPFSAGPRNCIGQKFAILEEKMVLAYVLRHFNVKSLHSPDDIKVCVEIVTRPKHSIMISLTPRI